MCKFTWNPKTRCLVNVGCYYVPWIGCSQLHTDVVSNASVSQGEGKPLSCFGASFNLFCGTAIRPFYKAPGLRCLLDWEAVCCHDWMWCFWRTGLCRVMLVNVSHSTGCRLGRYGCLMNEWMDEVPKRQADTQVLMLIGWMGGWKKCWASDIDACWVNEWIHQSVSEMLSQPANGDSRIPFGLGYICMCENLQQPRSGFKNLMLIFLPSVMSLSVTSPHQGRGGYRGFDPPLNRVLKEHPLSQALHLFLRSTSPNHFAGTWFFHS